VSNIFNRAIYAPNFVVEPCSLLGCSEHRLKNVRNGLMHNVNMSLCSVKYSRLQETPLVARSRIANCRHVFHTPAPHDPRSGTVVIHLEDPASNDFVVSTGLEASYSCVTSTSNRLMQTEIVSKKIAVQSAPSMPGNRELFAP